MKPAIIFITAFWLVIQTAVGQVKSDYKIVGTVADSASNKAIGYVTLSLKKADNTPVKTVLTKADGSFAFNDVKKESFIVSVIIVGYKTKRIKIDIADRTSNTINLGTIYISEQANKLKEVSVTAERPVIKQEVDRISYDLQADPESKSKNVIEMMKKVPLLSVDGDDNVQLKGNSNYRILINGKPSSMMERNAKDVLRSMPASSIQKIEVITTPPAKYDAEGLTGIINIITNKKVDDGYNGNINTSYRFPVGGPGTGGSFTVKKGKWGVSGYGGGSIYNTPNTQNTNSRITTGSAATNLFQTGTRDYNSNYGYLGSEISYEIDTLNLISAQFNINGNQNESENRQFSALNGNTGLMQGYELANAAEGRGSGLDAAVNYQLGFKADKNRLFTLSYRFYSYENEQFNNVNMWNRVHFTPADHKQNNVGKSAEHTFQLDYVHPVKKKLTIEAGLKGIQRGNKSDYYYDTLNTEGNYVTDGLRSNDFTNNQDVYSIYNSYHYNLKKWGVKAGLRFEQTVIKSNSDLKQNYSNLVPSFSVNTKLSKSSNLSLGYIQRIKRPGINQLNPFVDRSNPSFESGGNPNLRPMTASSIEVKYSRFKKGAINIMMGYAFFDKLVMPSSVFDQSTKITRTSFGNTGKARLVETNVNINYPLSSKWNVTLNGFAGYGKVEGVVNGNHIENEGLMYYVSSSSSYNLPKEWRLNASLNMNGPNLSLQGTSNSFIGCSFSVSKDIIKERLSFSASANNPFGKFRYYKNTMNGVDFTQESNNQNYLRTFNTSLNYRFGNLKSGLKKNKKGIVNDDVSNNGGGVGK